MPPAALSLWVTKWMIRLSIKIADATDQRFWFIWLGWSLGFSVRDPPIGWQSSRWPQTPTWGSNALKEELFGMRPKKYSWINWFVCSSIKELLVPVSSRRCRGAGHAVSMQGPPPGTTGCGSEDWANRFCVQLWQISTSPFSPKPACRFSAGWWWIRTPTSGGSFKDFGKGGQWLTFSKLAQGPNLSPFVMGPLAPLPHGPQVSVAPLSEGFKDHLELLSPRVIGPLSSPLRCPVSPFSCFSFAGFVHS